MYAHARPAIHAETDGSLERQLPEHFMYESNLIGFQIMSSKPWKGFREEMKALKQGKKGRDAKGQLIVQPQGLLIFSRPKS